MVTSDDFTAAPAPCGKPWPAGLECYSVEITPAALNALEEGI